MRVSAVSFGNNYTDADNRKKRAEEVVVGTGAAAAAGKKAGFSMFNSAKKVGMLQSETAEAARLVRQPIVKTRTLFGNFKSNSKSFSSKILGAFEGFKKLKYIKPIIESSLFRYSAAFFGTGLAVLTLIAGFTNIAKTSAIAMNEHITKSDFLNSLVDEENSKSKK